MVTTQSLTPSLEPAFEGHRVAESTTGYGGEPVRAPAPADDPLAEYELTALWLLGRVPPEALAGLPGALQRPGRAGRGAGPDVREATLAGPLGVSATGDVEVHLRATDFLRHGHAGDPAYGRLLVHLVWEDDRPAEERGTPLRLPGGRLAPTVAVAPALRGDPARLRALVALGPSGAEPCADAADRLGRADVERRLRLEGSRRLAERTWRAARLAERLGWEDAWAALLLRSLASSAGRRAEPAAVRDALVARITTAAGTPLLQRLGDAAVAAAAPDGRGPAALIELLRAPDADGRYAVGAGRAAEAGWNAALPLLAAAASAYRDAALGRATAALAGAWPAPRPYGRTRALAALLGPPDGASRDGGALRAPRDGGALRAQGLLHLQELWCARGGCGACPLSTG